MAKKKNAIDTSRLDDMLRRYGELCSQQRAAFILGISPRTVYKMLAEGKLARVGHRVDVRSICRYIETPSLHDYGGDSRGQFFSVSMNGKACVEP